MIGRCYQSAMRYVEVTKPGGPEVLAMASGPVPEPRAGEVLIRVKVAGVNRPDVLQRRGLYPPPPGASPILGLEIAGEVVGFGPEKPEWIRIGDKVCALVAGGGYAEYCTAPAVQCLPIPNGLTAAEAAAIPETFFTVWFNVFMRGRLQPRESLLIHGGTSGIGTTAIQLARATGANVFATAGSNEKCHFCLSLGATGAINYKTHDFVEEVRKLNNGRGVDMVLDMVAGDYFNRNLEVLAPDGRLVQIATQGGENVSLSFKTLMSKGITVTGSTLRPRTASEKGRIAAELRTHVWPLFESKTIRVVIDQEFDLEAVGDAHRHMERGTHMGKIVVMV